MKAITSSFLVLSLKTQLVTIESLQVPSALHRTPLSASSNSSLKRSTYFYLKEEKNGYGSGETESVSSPSGEEIDLDWKAIADYVFDESIDSTESLNLFEVNDEKQENETPHHHSKPIILFDGVCNLCNGGVNFAIDHDQSGKFRFASLQSNVAKSLLLRDGKDPSTTSDIVLVTPEKTYYSSEAVARIMVGLDMPVLKFFGVLGQVTPSFARNAVYKVVSGNRFILGENDSCRIDFDGEYTSRFVSDPPETISGITKKEDNEGD
jgi:predicted DCC family thiol-disulfide oxidoreductase YuxK